MMPSPSQIIVFATPAFLLLIALEWGVSLWRGRNAYRLADAISSISLGMLSQTSAVFTTLLRVGLYTLAFENLALWLKPELQRRFAEPYKVALVSIEEDRDHRVEL